jgi:hypothetical protein
VSEVTTVLPGLLALAISAYALYLSRAEARKTREEGTIRDSYDEFEQLCRLRMEHWSTSHLLETPDNYALVKRQLGIALAPLTDAERSKLLLLERAVGIAIFDLFEETYYRRDRAARQRDGGRVEFLDTVLDYFTGRLLANPRLRWLWSREGGNMCAFFEPETIRHYEAKLASGGELEDGDDVDQIDPAGPYLPAPEVSAA